MTGTNRARIFWRAVFCLKTLACTVNRTKTSREKKLETKRQVCFPPQSVNTRWINVHIVSSVKHFTLDCQYLKICSFALEPLPMLKNILEEYSRLFVLCELSGVLLIFHISELSLVRVLSSRSTLRDRAQHTLAFITPSTTLLTL